MCIWQRIITNWFIVVMDDDFWEVMLTVISALAQNVYNYRCQPFSRCFVYVSERINTCWTEGREQQSQLKTLHHSPSNSAADDAIKKLSGKKHLFWFMSFSPVLILPPLLVLAWAQRRGESTAAAPVTLHASSAGMKNLSTNTGCWRTGEEARNRSLLPREAMA